MDDGLPRHVLVTESELVEVSAVTDPGLTGTTLCVGNPGSRSLPKSTIERFSGRLE